MYMYVYMYIQILYIKITESIPSGEVPVPEYSSSPDHKGSGFYLHWAGAVVRNRIWLFL